MPQTAAVGDGPIVYFTDAGQQVSLPLSDIVFDGTDARSKTVTGVAALDKWLKYLVAQGRLAPAVNAVPVVDAMVLTATAPGSAGNRIEVTVTPNGTKVDVKVVEKDVYTGLTLDTIGLVLGVKGGAKGSSPGLVLLAQAIASGAPDPAQGPAAAIPPQGSALPTWRVMGSDPQITAPSFVLEARGPFSQLGTMTITVTNVQPPAGAGRATFTLEVEWESTATAVGPTTGDVLTLAQARTQLDALKFAVTVSEPTAGAGCKAPRPGTIRLRGGAEEIPATAASATLLANA